jgi:hypothetical protein
MAGYSDRERSSTEAMVAATWELSTGRRNWATEAGEVAGNQRITRAVAGIVAGVADGAAAGTGVVLVSVAGSVSVCDSAVVLMDGTLITCLLLFRLLQGNEELLGWPVVTGRWSLSG